MKSINRKDFIAVGSVSRTHGTRGELRLDLNSQTDFNEWAFLEIQGKPVPFYIESVAGTEDAPIIKLEGIDSMDEAAKLAGLAYLIPGKERKSKADASLIGYQLHDEEAGDLGLLEELVELPQQLFLKTTFNGKELLIPAVEDFIIDINKRKKIISLQLPEGLLDM